MNQLVPTHESPLTGRLGRRGESDTPVPCTFVTFGAELEWADWDTDVLIPEGLGFLNVTETEVCNSNGRAWDYSKQIHRYGGEICLQPVMQIDSMKEYVDYLAALLDPQVNYRCTLDIHVGVPTLGGDLEAQKQIASYADDNHDYVMDLFPPPEVPLGEYQGEERRTVLSYNRSVKRSRGSRVSPKAMARMMSATTVDEFQRGHFPRVKTASGERLGECPRCWCNLRSLVKHDTVEFRMFGGTTKGNEVASAALWCYEFLKHALGDREPVSVWHHKHEWTLPDYSPFSLDMEMYYRWTYAHMPDMLRATMEAENRSRFLPPDD